MARPSKKEASAAIVSSEASRVYKLLSRGLSVTQIISEIGLTRQRVNEYYDQWLAIEHQKAAELAEMSALRTMARLENMYGELSKHAYQLLDEGIFDKNIFNTMLSAMKEQREWVKLRTQGREAARGNTVNADTINVTISGNNPLYDRARHGVISQEPDDWLQYSDLDVDTIYLPSEDDIESKITELETKYGVTGEIDTDEPDDGEFGND